MPVLPTDPSVAYLWSVAQDEVSDPELIAGYEALLSDDERAQYRRFVTAWLRHEYLIAHALCRLALSSCADVDPRAWIFRREEHGRPIIEAPLAPPLLRFNLSHTRAMVAVLVAFGIEVGVDIEDTTRGSDTMKIAQRFFSRREAQALAACPPEDRSARFFDYWTLKESYIKARGLGLSLPLGQFSFQLDEAGPISISFDPRLGDEPEDWQFALYRPSVRHVMAAALHRGARADLRVVSLSGMPSLALG